MFIGIFFTSHGFKLTRSWTRGHPGGRAERGQQHGPAPPRCSVLSALAPVPQPPTRSRRQGRRPRGARDSRRERVSQPWRS